MYRKVKGEFGVNSETTQTTQKHQTTQKNNVLFGVSLVTDKRNLRLIARCVLAFRKAL